MNVRRRPTHTQHVSRVVLFKKVALVGCAILGVGLGLLATLGAKGEIFPVITTIECFTTQEEQCQSNVTAVLQTALGRTPLLFSNIPLTVYDPLVNTGFLLTKYQRQWPSTVRVVVTPAPLVYQIKTSSGAYGVMSDRRIVTLHEPQQVLNTVHMQDSIRPRDFAPPWLHTTIVNTVAVIHPTSMHLISPVELRVTVEEGPMEFILNPQEIEENLSRMHAIVTSTETTRLASVSGELDVRLRLPVLRKKP